MNEKKYLEAKINEANYNDNRYKLLVGSDKYVFGIISGKDSKAPFSKLLQYKTIYDTLKDIDYKLKISFGKAIEFAYSGIVQSNFSIFVKGSHEETMAYYYIENGLFRTSSLWDLLAQLYRLYYQIEVDADKVYYNRIFNPRSPNSDLFKGKAKEINDYIQQEDDTNTGGEWKGNHGYTNSCRNKMTHRNSPNVTVMSDYDVNLKQHPCFILKRIIEDYNVVSRYIGEILDNIENEVMNDFDETK